MKRFKFTESGCLKHGVVGLYIVYCHNGSNLLGEVTGVVNDYENGKVFLEVKHFNGEKWPVSPEAKDVEVIG